LTRSAKGLLESLVQSVFYVQETFVTAGWNSPNLPPPRSPPIENFTKTRLNRPQLAAEILQVLQPVVQLVNFIFYKYLKAAGLSNTKAGKLVPFGI
jgi:hypothetical protein